MHDGAIADVIMALGCRFAEVPWTVVFRGDTLANKRPWQRVRAEPESSQACCALLLKAIVGMLAPILPATEPWLCPQRLSFDAKLLCAWCM